MTGQSKATALFLERLRNCHEHLSREVLVFVTFILLYISEMIIEAVVCVRASNAEREREVCGGIHSPDILFPL